MPNIPYQSVFSTSHYSYSQRIDWLTDWANQTADEIKNALGDVRPIFIYAGMSGVSHATALMMVYRTKYGDDFGMLYVRKDEERSHGGQIEQCLNRVAGARCILVFVDDLVDSGDTRERVLSKAFDYLKAHRDSTFSGLVRFGFLQCIKEYFTPYRMTDHGRCSGYFSQVEFGQQLRGEPSTVLEVTAMADSYVTQVELRQAMVDPGWGFAAGGVIKAGDKVTVEGMKGSFKWPESIPPGFVSKKKRNAPRRASKQAEGLGAKS